MVFALPSERFEGIDKDVVLLNAPLEGAQLAAVLVIAPENDAQRAPKEASRGLQEGPSKALDRSVWQPLEASRSPQAANPKC